MTPTTDLGLSIRFSMFELRETGDCDIFLGSLERARVETVGDNQWVARALHVYYNHATLFADTGVPPSTLIQYTHLPKCAFASKIPLLLFHSRLSTSH